MAVLLLDPLVLALVLGLAVHVWLVVRGSIRGWLGRPARWTTLVWPLPALVLIVSPAGAAGFGVLSLMGIGVEDGGTIGALAYAVVYLGPLVWLAVLPPRWLLPAWARHRLVRPPPRGQPSPGGARAGVPAGALGAVNAARGHGSAARWVWRVDGVPGWLWIDGDVLRFRAVSGDVAPVAFDDEALAELRSTPDGDLQLHAPRGGWWARTHLDVDLVDVDRRALRSRRPWRRDGLFVLEVDGRAPLHLWVDDVHDLVVRLPPGPA